MGPRRQECKPLNRVGHRLAHQDPLGLQWYGWERSLESLLGGRAERRHRPLKRLVHAGRGSGTGDNGPLDRIIGSLDGSLVEAQIQTRNY